VTAASSTRAVLAVAAHMSLKPMGRRPSPALDPTHLAILFTRGGDDGGIDKRPGLDPDRLGLELISDLVEQRFVQRLSDALQGTGRTSCARALLPGKVTTAATDAICSTSPGNARGETRRRLPSALPYRLCGNQADRAETLRLGH
jgi:hypothetical protein